jgi:glycosyltransferase involved in cell wall biosynthesis
LEALGCGTPVVTSAGLALDDLWPEYPLRCDDLTSDAIARTTLRVLDDDALAAEVAAAAESVLAGCGWESSARQLTAELRRTVDS